ncbi:DNA gyrase inhibitor YacG [Acidovorax sp. Be4]|uniref:DNA gyrase inhibitor YacG n=1 Tax=Acidovorax bellezanensis TaxID=2976702 RepID=A0ABT2PSB4_9BURK|nr:DNA gyrase inhibitor YacG [Acidovorax sp. Be4]MCT9813358.1 DNA gyrase inhibitor YacG [Acidovorax sp. Be4]
MTNTPPPSPAAPKPAAPIVRCPSCGGRSVFSPENRWRPFCSERCRQIDLGAWANEEFRVPSPVPPEGAPYGDPREQD